MRNLISTLATAVLLTSSLFSADISIPVSLSCKPGRLVVINAVTTADNVVWIWDKSEDADVITTNDSGSKAIFNTDTEGVYNVIAIIAVMDGTKPKVVKSNICVITVGKPKPPPDPIPPPDPTPALDDFQKQLHSLYKSNGYTKSRMLDLAKFYVDALPFINDPAVANSLALHNSLQDTANIQMKQDLMEIRKATSAYMKTKLPALAGDLTPDLRKQWSDMFSYLSISISKVVQ